MSSIEKLSIALLFAAGLSATSLVGVYRSLCGTGAESAFERPATSATLESRRPGTRANDTTLAPAPSSSAPRGECKARGARAAGSAAPALLRGLDARSAYGKLLELSANAELAAGEREGLAEVAEAPRLDPELRGLAILALARAGDPSAAEAALAPDRPAALRATAVQVLLRHGGERGRELVARIAGSERDATVRQSAERALASFAPEAVSLSG